MTGHMTGQGTGPLAGVRVRVLGDRAALFEADPYTKVEFYWLAN